MAESRAVTRPTRSDDAPDSVPPIRRPILFYASAMVAFGLLGAAVLALLL